MTHRAPWPHAALLALPCLAALPAAGAVRCTDSAGNAYLLAQDPGVIAGLGCEAVEAPPPDARSPVDTEANAPDVPGAFDVAVLVARVRGARMHAGRGLLVLAPPARDDASFEPVAQRTDVLRATAFDALIVAVARTYGQDADLLRAIVHVESRFDPNAVSPRGAIGLMQVMPATATELGLAEPQRALFEPESNLRTGALYLRSLFERFAGQPALAIAAYNAGAGAVARSGNAVPPIAETQKYVQDVLAAWQRLRVGR